MDRGAAAAVTVGAHQAGRPWPLGARYEVEGDDGHGVDDGGGVNFAVVSAHASAVELCLFDATGRTETARLPLARSNDVWHSRLPGARPGLVYGFRAHGPWAPDAGHRFNACKLLLDPYAREIVGADAFTWRDEHFGHRRDDPTAPDARDNGPWALKARVVDEAVAWTGPLASDRPPRTPLADTVLYEAHVKGLTMRHPGVPEALRGTYAGLASDAVIAHLHHLGITAVSLLPVQQHLDEERLGPLGLVNHWGYNTIGFFAVEPRLAARPERARDEFRTMVARLHAAGIEVILDVVYNHSAETDAAGPTLSWRGLDNALYYRALPGDPGHLDNLSGCGNAFDLRQPRVLQLVADSLRHWVEAFHVDGFRFDLAPVLGRGDAGFDARHAFFQTLAQDPVLAGVKLIAEPWDLGPGGYRLGGFPPGWLEWNDRFRDGARRFWLQGATAGEFATRLCASSDVFRAAGRAPGDSVNFIVAHDGFTLRDLVTYERRRNAANGEDGRDGHAENLGWNAGVEGETPDVAVRALRLRLQRALLATLAFAQGTPMLAAGAELGHTQAGNNNAYCQDNATAWIDWAAADAALIDFTARVFALRRRLRPFGARWFDGAAAESGGAPDLAWLHPDGRPFGDSDWDDAASRSLGALVSQPDGGSAPLLLLVNPDAVARPFALPAGAWARLIDSAVATEADADGVVAAPTALSTTAEPAAYPLQPRSVTLLGMLG